MTNPFSLSCEFCGADERYIRAIDDEYFKCEKCGKVMHDPIPTQPMRGADLIPDDDDRTIHLITRDMLHGND